jgi:hypothetical protein
MGSAVGNSVISYIVPTGRSAVYVNDKEYIASLRYDNSGRIIQVDIPVGYTLNHISENPEDFVETHKYIYGSKGELIQSTIIKDLKDAKNTPSYDLDTYYYKHGFTIKLVTEYHYDSNGKLTQEVQHSYEVDYVSGWDGWTYTTKSYEYDASGKCISNRLDSYGIRLSHPEDGEAYNYLFNNDGIVDAQSANIVELWGEDLDYMENNVFITEYEYGSIYIYNPKA